jgi:hypothetical protein
MGDKMEIKLKIDPRIEKLLKQLQQQNYAVLEYQKALYYYLKRKNCFEVMKRGQNMYVLPKIPQPQLKIRKTSKGIKLEGFFF